MFGRKRSAVATAETQSQNAPTFQRGQDVVTLKAVKVQGKSFRSGTSATVYETGSEVIVIQFGSGYGALRFCAFAPVSGSENVRVVHDSASLSEGLATDAEGLGSLLPRSPWCH